MRRRLTKTLIGATVLLLVFAPTALAHAGGGEGWYGETTDQTITNAAARAKSMVIRDDWRGARAICASASIGAALRLRAASQAPRRRRTLP